MAEVPSAHACPPTAMSKTVSSSEVLSLMAFPPCLTLRSVSAGIFDFNFTFALVLGVDRILDMCRTAVNVTGDLTATVVIARSEGYSLEAAPSD